MESRPNHLTRSVSFSDKTTKPSLVLKRSASFTAASKNSDELGNEKSNDVLASEETGITDGSTYVIYEDRITPRSQGSLKSKESSKGLPKFLIVLYIIQSCWI